MMISITGKEERYRKEGSHMGFKKIGILLALILIAGFLGCAKKEKVEIPKQEQVTKNLVPPQMEVKGAVFLVQLSDLKVNMTVRRDSKEIVETPGLQGHIKITNKSKDVLDIQGVTLEYLDETGKPIPFKSGEKVAKVSSFWKALKPEEVAEGSLYDVTIPRAAFKEKPLAKIEINLVYVPSPLKRETLTLPEKVE
jgi:hypothetical protein